LLYLTARASHTPPLLERIKLLPLLTITGFGLCLSTSIAVLEGLFGKGSAVFVRTPKLNLNNAPQQKKSVDHNYVSPISPLVWLELVLGFYALISGIILTPLIGWGILPWMIIYMLGFFYIAGMNIIQNRQQFVSRQPRSRKINVT
jgi:hypothetical protein